MHHHARKTAEVSLEVLRANGQDAALSFVRNVLTHQSEIDEAALRRWRDDLALQTPQSNEPRLTLSVTDQLNRDAELAYRLGINQTPSFRVNGIAVDGAAAEEQFARLIESELHATQALLKRSVPEGSLYARRVQENHPHNVARTAETTPPDERIWAIPVDNSPVLGPKVAEVTLVAFLDLECPYCSQAFETLLLLNQKYAERLTIVWKHRPLPFHAHAESAARLLDDVRREHGNAAFFSTAQELLSHQEQYSDTYFESIAQRFSLKRRPTDPLLSPSNLERDLEVAEDFDVVSTPQFFLNGHRLQGTRSLKDFSSLVDKELARADSLRPKVTSPEGLAALMTAGALPAPEPKRIEVPQATDVGPSFGNPRASVTIHVFSDYQCPFCKAAEPVLKNLLSTYPKEVRIEWHDLPLTFHERARPAATMARAVYYQSGRDKFAQFVEQLFQRQPDLSEPVLEGLANAVGLKPEAHDPIRRETAYGAAIDHDIELARSLAITSTPTFVVGNYVVEGLRPERYFRRLIRQSLATLSERKKTRASNSHGKQGLKETTK
jgi:protein-disulfide isomerase